MWPLGRNTVEEVQPVAPTGPPALKEMGLNLAGGPHSS